MQIKINNELVDFTLEKEQNLQDILTGIQTWLEQEGYRIEQYCLNGRDILPEDDIKIRETPAGDIELLEITALSAQEILVQKYHTIHQFLSLCSKALTAENIPLWEDLKKEYPAVRQGISTYLLDNSESSKEIITGLDSLVSSESLPPEEHRIVLHNMTALAAERLRELTIPVEELKKTISVLLALKDRIQEIPILLQTGKDKQAFSTILGFIELNQKIQRLILRLQSSQQELLDSILVDGTSLGEFYNEFNQILKELLSAFEHQDTVLAGDLFEYEIIPRLDTLGQFTEQIHPQEEAVNE